jgi:hypothetical protein
LDAQYKDWLRQTEYPGKQLEQQKGIISAMAPLAPKTETIYGQKEKASSTAAGLLGATASALGIKTMDDLVKKAKEYGLTPENFKNMLGISVNPTGSVRNEEDLSKLTPEQLQKLYEQEGGGSTTPSGVTPILPPEGDESSTYYPSFTPDFGGYDPEEFSMAAEGGLVGMLHKMRSHK